METELRAAVRVRRVTTVNHRGLGRWKVGKMWIVEDDTQQLPEGFLIHSINGQTPQTTADFEKLLANTDKGKCTIIGQQGDPEDESEFSEDEEDDESIQEDAGAANQPPEDKVNRRKKSTSELEQTQELEENDETSTRTMEPLKTYEAKEEPEPEEAEEPAEAEEQETAEEPDEEEQPESAIIEVTLQIEEGEPLGITPDSNLMVTKVQAGSVADGKLELGDVILRMNGIRLDDPTRFWFLLGRCRSGVTLEVERNRRRSEELQSHLLPTEVERLIVRRAGYEYKMFQIDCTKEPRRALGMAIDALWRNHIMVTKVAPGSAAADHFQQYDRVVAIDRIPVSEKDVVKSMIVDRAGKFEATVERPATQEALNSLEQAHRQRSVIQMTQEGDAWANFQMPEDVQEIVDQEMGRRRDDPEPELAPLRRTPSVEARIQFKRDPLVVHIHSDVHPDKQLRKAPGI